MYRRFQRILKRDDLCEVYHQIKVKAEIQDILHCCCGIAEATSVKNFQQIFDFLHPVLVESVQVYGKFDIDIFSWSELLQYRSGQVKVGHC
jgi:hypothetical protein